MMASGTISRRAKKKPAPSASEVMDFMQTHIDRAWRNGDLDLFKEGAEARVDSAKSEREITKALRLHFLAAPWFKKNKLEIEVGKLRHWFDFKVSTLDGKLNLPVNIKISAKKSADNISSKAGLFYALTGVDPTETILVHPDGTEKRININGWDNYFLNLDHFLGDNKKADYYFLVIDKDMDGGVFWTSLKQIQELHSSGENLPFQANWAKNTKRKKRSFNSAKDYLLGIFRESLVVRANTLKVYDQYMK